MKKYKYILVILLSVIVLFLVVAYKEDTIAELALENDQLVLKTGSKYDPEILKPWYNWEDGKYHIFLPSYLKDLESFTNEDGTKQLPLEQEIEYAGNQIVVHKSANLPALYINTESQSNYLLHSDKEIKEAGEIKLINNEGISVSELEMEYITGRGNSTFDFDKKPYTLKLKSSVSFLGMEPGNKWVLLANSYEGTKVIYKMMLDMAANIGLQYTPEAQWVDLYMNGEYVGNYLLCKALYIGQGSVDIPGGILIEKDTPAYYMFETEKFLMEEQFTFTIKHYENTTEEELAGLTEYFNHINGLIKAGDKEAWNYLDTDSLAKVFLMYEIAYNSDANVTSTYFYKQTGNNLLMCGPVWDFDGSFGESNEQWTNYNGTVLDIKNNPDRVERYLAWNDILYENDAEYYEKVVNHYKSLLPYLEFLVEEGIDQYVDYIEDSVQMDMIRWDYGENTAGHYSTLDNNIRYLKFFLSKRISMLNERWGLEAYSEPELANGEVHKVTFEVDGQVVHEEMVKDGEFLTNIPQAEEGKCWMYSRDCQLYNEYLPVYEDMSLYMDVYEE